MIKLCLTTVLVIEVNTITLKPYKKSCQVFIDELSCNDVKVCKKKIRVHKSYSGFFKRNMALHCAGVLCKLVNPILHNSVSRMKGSH